MSEWCAAVGTAISWPGVLVVRQIVLVLVSEHVIVYCFVAVARTWDWSGLAVRRWYRIGAAVQTLLVLVKELSLCSPDAVRAPIAIEPVLALLRFGAGSMQGVGPLWLSWSLALLRYWWLPLGKASVLRRAL